MAANGLYYFKSKPEFNLLKHLADPITGKTL